MIWINNNSDSIQIPKHTETNGETYNLKLINDTTKKEYVFDHLYDRSDSALLYEFEFTPPALMDEGQYSYYLNGVISTESGDVENLTESGLLIFGNYQRQTDVSEFTPETNTIIQFNG